MYISTLGPQNTNSQFAAEYYLASNSLRGEVLLYDTPEKAIDYLIAGSADKSILCVVYPRLNEIVFQNLGAIRMSELFRYDTDNMVIAGHKPLTPDSRICSHPAPTDLVPDELQNVTLVNSNSYAASLVADGKFDACVTTLKAARQFELDVIRDFGPVSMGWAVFDRV